MTGTSARRAWGVVLVLAGILIAALGMFARGIEAYYASYGGNFEIGNGNVYDIDEATGSRELVFSGTASEANAWVESQRDDNRANLTVYNLVVAAAVAATFGGIVMIVKPRRVDAPADSDLQSAKNP